MTHLISTVKVITYGNTWFVLSCYVALPVSCGGIYLETFEPPFIGGDML